MLKQWGFLRPDRWAVVLVLLLTFGQSMSGLYLPNLMSKIVDTGVLTGDIHYILRMGALMLLITALGGAASVGASWYAARAMSGFSLRLRERLFAHVEGFTLREFDHIGTSSLIVRTTNDVMQVQQLVNMMLRMMVMAPLTAIGGIILAVALDAKLSLVIVVAIPVLGLAIYAVMGRGLGLFRLIQEKIDRLNRVLRENLTGVRVIRAFNRTQSEADRFDVANRDVTDTAVEVFQLMAAVGPVIGLVMNLSTIAVVWFGGLQINAGHLQIGQLMAFIQYLTQIMFAVMMLSMMSFMIPRGEASAKRINEVLAMAPEISEPERPAHLPAGPLAIAFDHVTFRYPGAEEPALSDITFTAEAGQVTAIIGGTGAGKSTLLNLILRFYDVAAGTVQVGGVDVRSLPQAELRQRVGYVPQRAVLFGGSIADNVRYGALQAPEDRVRGALETAQAVEFVDAMEGGVAAEIQQAGANLSGGQKQRLSIARALARRPDIYLFDDSFSALDFKTDAQLRAALRREVAQATVLIVAQRVSSIMDADQIVVIDDGRVAAVGTHARLLDTSPVYQEIVASQLTPGEIA